MVTRTFGQDFNALSRVVGEWLEALGPLGRRLALTAFGAVLALGLGAATASAFRLPSEVTDPPQPQDQVLAQSELPSEAVARAYALENLPVYTTATDRADDMTPTVDATPVDTAALPEDASPTPAVIYTVPADDASPTIKAGANSPAPASTPTADDAG